MKAISLKQPWATLMALGEKRLETRPVLFAALDPRNHQGEPILVAICASKTWKRDQADLMDVGPFSTVLGKHGITSGNATHETMPRGTVVGVARVTAVSWTGSGTVRKWLAGLPEAEKYFGDFEPNRVIYHCDRVWKTHDQMIFVKGRLGVFDLPADVEHRLLVDLQHHHDLPPELTNESLFDEAVERAQARKRDGEELDWLLKQFSDRKQSGKTPMDRLIDKAVNRD